PAALRSAGVQPAALRSAGVQPAALRSAGVQPAAIRAAGVQPAALRAAGVQPAALRAAGGYSVASAAFICRAVSVVVSISIAPIRIPCEAAFISAASHLVSLLHASAAVVTAFAAPSPAPLAMATRHLLNLPSPLPACHLAEPSLHVNPTVRNRGLLPV